MNVKILRQTNYKNGEDNHIVSKLFLRNEQII